MNGKSKDPEVAHSWGWMPQLLFSIFLNSEEVGLDVSDGIDLLARREQATNEQKLLSFMSLDFQQKVWPGLKMGFPSSKIYIKSVSSYLKDPN